MKRGTPRHRLLASTHFFPPVAKPLPAIQLFDGDDDPILWRCRSKGGTNHKHNLVTACVDCNQGKKASNAPHPDTLPRWRSILSNDQMYILELLEGAHWRNLWRQEAQSEFEAQVAVADCYPFEFDEELDEGEEWERSL